MATDLTLCRKTPVTFTSVKSKETLHLAVPVFLHSAFEIIDRGLSTEGIFRKCGSIARQKLLKPCLYGDLPLPMDTHILDAGSLVKEFFRLLSVPVFTRELQSFFIEAAKQPDDRMAAEVLLNLILLLPTDFWHCLAFLMRKLLAVSHCHESNLMKSDSLAKLFAVNLFRDEELMPTVVAGFDHQLFNLKTRVVELLINNADRIGIISEYEKLMTPDLFASLVPVEKRNPTAKVEPKKEKNPFVKRLKKAIVDPMKHLTNMNGHQETPMARGSASAYNKRKSFNLASTATRRQNSAGGATRYAHAAEFYEPDGWNLDGGDAQRRISRSVDDIDCLHDAKPPKLENIRRSNAKDFVGKLKKPENQEDTDDLNSKTKRRSDKKGLFGKNKKRSRSSSTEQSNRLQLPKSHGQPDGKMESKWYASAEESDVELHSDIETAYGSKSRQDGAACLRDKNSFRESSAAGRLCLKHKRRSVSESVLSAVERFKSGGRLMRGKPNSLQVGLMPPPQTTLKRRPSRSLDSVNHTFDHHNVDHRQFDSRETSTPRPNDARAKFFNEFPLRPVEIPLEDIFTPGSAAFDGLKVSFDVGFADLVEEIMAKQISLVSNKSNGNEQLLLTPGSSRSRSQSATELRSFCGERDEPVAVKSPSGTKSPGSHLNFVVHDDEFLHSELRRMAIVQMKSPSDAHEDSGNDVFNSRFNSPQFHNAESLQVPISIHPKACDRPSLAFIRQERGGLVKNTVDKFNRLSGGSSSSSLNNLPAAATGVSVAPIPATRSRRRYGLTEGCDTHADAEEPPALENPSGGGGAQWKKNSRKTYGYTPPVFVGAKQRRSKGNDRRSTIATSPIARESTEEICSKVVLLDLNDDTPKISRYNTRLSVERASRMGSSAAGPTLSTSISLLNVSIGPSSNNCEEEDITRDSAPVRRTQSDRLRSSAGHTPMPDVRNAARRTPSSRKSSVRSSGHSKTRKRRVRDTPRKPTM